MFNGRRQPSRDGTSRMTRECQVRFCERLGVKFPGPTRQNLLSPVLRPWVRFASTKRHAVTAGSCSARQGAFHKGRYANPPRLRFNMRVIQARDRGSLGRLRGFELTNVVLKIPVVPENSIRPDSHDKAESGPSHAMVAILHLLGTLVVSLFKSRRRLEVEHGCGDGVLIKIAHRHLQRPNLGAAESRRTFQQMPQPLAPRMCGGSPAQARAIRS